MGPRKLITLGEPVQVGCMGFVHVEPVIREPVQPVELMGARVACTPYMWTTYGGAVQPAPMEHVQPM